LVLADPRLPESELMKRYLSREFYNEYMALMCPSKEKYDSGLIRNHFHIPLSLLGNASRPGARLLDVGSGAGFFLRAAAEVGWSGDGIEVSAALAAYGRQVLGVRIREETIETADIPPETYDAVVLLDVIEHVREPGEMLEKTARILRPGGKLVVGTPDFRSLSRWILGRNWAILSPAEHLFNFTSSTLARMLEAAEFQVRGPVNILVFNPDATHARGTRRHRLWRDFHERLENNSAMRKIQSHEVRRVLRLADGHETGVRATIGKRFLLRLYEGLRTVVNGDMLYALAIKK